MRNIWCSAAILSLFFSGVVFAQKRNITEKDLFSFVWIGDTELAPDGSRAVFVKTTVNAKRDGYTTALFIVDLERPGAPPRQLTSGPHDSQPRWSPDGRNLAFIRALEKDGKPEPGQLFLLPLAGGEAVQISTLTKGASSPHWSPDGASIAVLSDMPIVAERPAGKTLESSPGKSTATAAATDSDSAKKEEEHKSDVRIIAKAAYRSNGRGYLDGKDAAQIFVFPLPAAGESAPAPLQLTDDRFGIDEFAWHPGSKYLYYLSEHTDEPYYALPRADVYLLSAPTAENLKSPSSFTRRSASLAAKLPVEEAADLAISPDGKRLAFHAEDQPTPPRSYQQPDLFLLDIDPAQPAPATPSIHNLTAGYDYEIGGGVGGDNAAPRGAGHVAPVWSADGASILDLSGKLGSGLLVSVNAATGAVSEWTAEKQAVLGFTMTPDGKKLVALISTPVNIGDLFLIAPDGSKQQTQLTRVNEALFSQLNLTMPEVLEVAPTARSKDIDGHTIETWVQRPPDFDPAKKYPLILDIHGGPHSAYGWVFDHEFQWMAARGYVVVYPNPRGSTTYGQTFANVIQYNYPGNDFHDLMDSVDAVIKLGYVDPDKLGVTGGSGGGLLTDWTVTQTNRFKAAVAQRDITDWSNWWYTDDFTLFQPTWFKGAPFEQPEEFREHSPITYVTNIRTPMMFILGDADYRTPPTAGGEDFFRALKYRHIDTVMVRFPGESHELSRSGQPWHRIERLENIVDWFDKYLKGMPEPQYDVLPATAQAEK